MYFYVTCQSKSLVAVNSTPDLITFIIMIA